MNQFCVKLNRWKFEYLRATQNLKLYNRRMYSSICLSFFRGR
jgi:hypothetical protein